MDYLIRHRYVTSWLARDVGALTHEAVFEVAQDLSGRINQLLTTAAEDATDRIWGAAITQALTGPMLSDINVSDEELRSEVESIGECLIRGHQNARRRARADRSQREAS